MGKKTDGTKEWASSNVNIQYGCRNGCTYGYAFTMAKRFKRSKTYEEWITPVINEKAIQKNYRKREGRIMFPTSHDIDMENHGFCAVVLLNLLKVI